MTKKIQQILMATLILASCKTVSKTSTSDYDYMYITKQGIIQRPLITELEVAKQRVTMTKTYKNITISDAKEKIMGEFIQQNSCDVIVQPFFSTNSEATTGKSNVTITITGYAASFKNIRLYEAKDSAFLLPRGGIYIVPSKTPLETSSSQQIFKKPGLGASLMTGRY